MTSGPNQIREFLKHKAGLLAVLIFLGLTAWRISLFFLDVDYRDNSNQIWSASYQLMAVWGVLCGLYFSKFWGGWHSAVGRANLAFALGLCAQLFGQSTFSYFFYNGIDVPYPSIADIGFFGSIPFYIYGAFVLIKVSGGRIKQASALNQILAFAIPMIMLLLSYIVFLRGYELDATEPLKTFLDLGYPLGQALYVSLALLAYLLCRNTLGGIMRGPMFLFVAALIAQYAADYMFLYQSNAGTFVGGGIVDYLYLLAYFVMSVALIQLAVAFRYIERT